MLSLGLGLCGLANITASVPLEMWRWSEKQWLDDLTDFLLSVAVEAHKIDEDHAV